MSVFNAVMALSGMIDTDVIENEKLARHTSYRIGGKADLFIACHSYHSLRRTIEVLSRERVPWVIIGKGSNLLVADEGYRGAVITLGSEFSRFVLGEDGSTITVGAGAILARVVNEALSKELSGLEFAVGIPGTVGGAISMNAGSRTEWIGSLVEDVVTYKPGSGIRHYACDDVAWGYRECGLPRDEIVLEVTLRLNPAPKDEIRTRMERALSRRRRTQPLGVPSCGSVFRNPPDRAVGALIEECGLKGFSQGGAEVSSVHANFIVNKGAATADDVASVIRHVHGKVKEIHGVELQPEVKFLGF
ncbi:MAG: UDP-N-acetylmuramate dehydrogenase [Coriobacteriaceae bacterium]|nr:UDP-N-acetylmuramate dehydrogenase [Coriobacteriaceae bacterium]